MEKLAAILGLLLVAGCAGEMDKQSEVEKLRILALSADPPEIQPGEGATFRALWADPEGKGRDVTFAWMACAGPFEPGAMCEPAMPPVVRSASEGGDAFVVPVAPALDPTVMLVVRAGGETVTAMKRVTVSRSGTPNHNPGIEKLVLNGKALEPADDGGVATVKCTADDGCPDAEVQVFLTKESFETYETQGLGGVEMKTDQLYVSWFVVGGEADKTRTGAGEPGEPLKMTWSLPEEGGELTLYVVAHDTRGGVSWKRYAVKAAAAR
ncbi:MAG: hypothetical protein PHU25_12055 [Deltaproteobacteria bacterium]|nr:hypothetical protein [Deltaproteobacteria bacterium]